MNQGTVNIIIAIVAVLWPMLVTALDRAYGRGEHEERLKRIEQDVKEIRGLFTLTLRPPP